MYYKRALFGYSPKEVEQHVSRLETEAAESFRQIEALERQLRMAEYDRDDLKTRLRIYDEIRQSRSEPK